MQKKGRKEKEENQRKDKSKVRTGWKGGKEEKARKRLRKSTKIKTKKMHQVFFLGRFYSTSVFLTSNNRHIQFKYVKRKMHHHLPLT